MELLTTTLIAPILTTYFKQLPLWAKIALITAAILLGILIFGIILSVIWITFSFISSGVWSSLPPQVAASIVAGLFAVITLLLGNSITKEREIKSTLKLKEIEAQETSLAKKTEFYIELIDRLIILRNLKDDNQVDELFKNFYGKLYTQASPEIIKNFLQIVDAFKINGNDSQILEANIQLRVDTLIDEIRQQLNQDRKKIALSYSPSSFNK